MFKGDVDGGPGFTRGSMNRPGRGVWPGTGPGFVSVSPRQDFLDGQLRDGHVIADALVLGQQLWKG